MQREGGEGQRISDGGATHSIKVSDAWASAVVVFGLNATGHRDGRGAVRRGAGREREREQEHE